MSEREVEIMQITKLGCRGPNFSTVRYLATVINEDDLNELHSLLHAP